MKTSRAVLKLRAKTALLGTYGSAVGSQLIIYGISVGLTIVLEFLLIGGIMFSELSSVEFGYGYVMAMVFAVYGLILFMEMMIIPGIQRLFLNISKGEPYRVSDVFFAFRNHAGKFILVALALGLISVILMSPNFIISYAMNYTGDYSYQNFYFVFNLVYMIIMMLVSIYFGLTYGQFYLILVEDPEKGIIEALLESRDLMRGNRGRFFVLGLSFIGWFMLVYLTFGIGLLWIFPYLSCTYIQFYLDLKPQAEVTFELLPESIMENS